MSRCMLSVFKRTCLVLVAAALPSDNYMQDSGIGFPLYLCWLAKEVVLSNIDVARRILHPKLPISPTMFYVKASQKTPGGQVIYANSITLTPGTITVRLRDGYLIVHSISREAADAVKEGTMDRKVTAIEGVLPE